MGNKKITISIVAVLVIAIVSLGVAFAAFSTTLNINGSAEVEATSWDIFFTTENDGAKPTQETTVPNTNIDPHGTATNNSATILATTFNWNANFKSPGDKIIYTIYVKNGGNYNAQVSSINTPQISCSNDTKNACQQLSYGLYTDTAGNTPLSTSFTVNAGATEVFYLIATLSENYGGNGSGLVTSDITTSTISATVTFEQTSSAVSNSGNSGGNGGNSGGEEPTQDIYLKTVSGEQNVCVLYNSTEYCFDRTIASTDVSQFCTSVGETSTEGSGCNGGEAEYCEFGDYRLSYEEALISEFENPNRSYVDITITNNTSNYSCFADLYADPNDYQYDTSYCN